MRISLIFPQLRHTVARLTDDLSAERAERLRLSHRLAAADTSQAGLKARLKVPPPLATFTSFSRRYHPPDCSVSPKEQLAPDHLAGVCSLEQSRNTLVPRSGKPQIHCGDVSMTSQNDHVVLFSLSFLFSADAPALDISCGTERGSHVQSETFVYRDCLPSFLTIHSSSLHLRPNFQRTSHQLIL